MKPEKILILKNDRGGDLFISLKTISSLLKNNDVTIYLSSLNIGFKFLFKKAKILEKKVKQNFIDKIKLIIDIYKNNYNSIYILTPKNFYFFLPVFFWKTKFYAIVIDNNKKNRPNVFLRNLLTNYKVINRDKLNKKRSSLLQLELLNKSINVDENYSNLTIPEINNSIKSLLPKNFIFFQFKKTFFNKLNWSINEFNDLTNFFLKKYDNVLFSSDIEYNDFNKYFVNNYSYIDTKNNKILLKNNNKIYYLKDVNSQDLFTILNYSSYIVCPHGLITHISRFLNKDSLNLFNFSINSNKDIAHEKISFSEWYLNMNLNFIFLNKDINKSISKISKFI